MEIKEVKAGDEDFWFLGDVGNGGGGSGTEGLTVFLIEARSGERLGTKELTELHFGARTGDAGPVELSVDGDVERIDRGGGGAFSDVIVVVGVSSSC